ncbi:MAG: response regulator transcription factor [Spirochaetia bacterium]
MIEICIVDDHPIFRKGLMAILDQDQHMKVTSECSTAGEAIDLMEKKVPDFIFIDISLQGMNGIELSKYLHQNYPDLKICILSMHDESVYADRAIRAGAKGYIMKQEAGKKVRDAVIEISQGKYFLNETLKDRILSLLLNPNKLSNNEDCVHSLSNREFEVFLCIGRGMGNLEIGDQLHISPKTIETYKRNICQKLGMQDSSSLRKFAIQWRHDNL